MTSILPASLKIQDLIITDDTHKLIWDFTLRCQTKKSLSLTIELKPGVESFTSEISFEELKPSFKSTIDEIMKGRKTSFPMWKLKLSFTDKDRQQTFGTTFRSAPENWFWKPGN